MTGRIFDIQRFSLHDGPGIRTTVFLKGCPLRCRWCHNPESVDGAPVLSYAANRCLRCGACAGRCGRGVHVVDAAAGRHGVERTLCIACGRCTEVCPGRALEVVGRPMEVDDVLTVVLRDEPFYATSGGGLTVSGGEPLAQPAFTRELLAAARRSGLHTAMETSGAAPWRVVAAVVPHVDLFLFDIKETDPDRHRAATGSGNGEILANLRRLHDEGASVRLRLPLVPGLNLRPEHLEGVLALVAGLPRLAGADLLPYHPYGQSKRARFGLGDDPLQDTPAPNPDLMRQWANHLRLAGVPDVTVQ